MTLFTTPLHLGIFLGVAYILVLSICMRKTDVPFDDVRDWSGMKNFRGVVVDVQDIAKIAPHLKDTVGGRYQILADMANGESFLFYCNDPYKPGVAIAVEDDEASWNGVYWEISGVL